MDIYKEILKSVDQTHKNPILLLPKIFALITSILLFAVFLVYSGVMPLFIDSGFSFIQFKWLIGALVKDVGFWIYLLLEFIIASYFSGMSYGMYRDIVSKKKTDLKKGLAYGWKYLTKIMEISIIYYLLIGVPIFGLYYAITTPFFTNKLVNYSFVLVIAFIIMYWIFLVMLRMLFVYATLVFKKGSVSKTIQRGAHFGKMHFKHTLTTWLIVTGISLWYNSVRNPITNVIQEANIVYLVGIIVVFFAVLEIVISVWEQLFIFNVYMDEK